MSRLDIIIFGATGFTGRKAVEELARVSSKTPIEWGVAGRAQNRLEALLVDVGNRLGKDLSKVKVIIADVKDEQSLKDMTSQTKLVANCCGPYRHFGEPVIKACIETKTHHLDISGEPEFMERMQLQYSEPARSAGVYVVSACGFDSVPNDMGVEFLRQQFPGTLNSVESYIKSSIAPEYTWEAVWSGSIHYGTWESLVHSLSNWRELGPLRKQLFPEPLPPFKPKLKPRQVLHKRGDSWCLPFPGADNSIVYRTQRYIYETTKQRPVQFRAYVQSGNILITMMMIFSGLLLYVMTKCQFTRGLLLKFPRVFSMGLVTKDGPKEEVMNNTKFTFELFGEGWAEGADVDNTPPNKKMAVKVKGVNPGYGATVTALIFAALTVLNESNKMPDKGGVLTTGAAFSKTDYVKHLNQNNLTFEIVKD